MSHGSFEKVLGIWVFIFVAYSVELDWFKIENFWEKDTDAHR